MKNKYLLIALISLSFTSCKDFHIVSSPDYKYWFYIDGDKGKQVEISYTEGEHNPNGATKNITTTETVTLPVFKGIHYVYEGGFIKVKSTNDSTTKILGFGLNLSLEDKHCMVLAKFETANATGDCAYCKELSTDSVFRYLKKIGYKNYLEFKKGDSENQIQFP